MEISQHIKDLLLTYDRVILPDFGAFMAKYKPAKINEENNTMSPPTKEIVFDPKIIKDSGLIEKQMSEKEKISVDEAKSQIDEYVKTVKSKLNAGKKVKFPELGTFSKIKDGDITFVYEPSGNLLLDSYGLPKISLPKVAKAASDKSTKTVKTTTMKTSAPKISENSTGGKTKIKPSLIIGAAALLVVLIFVSIVLFNSNWRNAVKNKTSALYHSVFKSKKNDKTDKIAEVNTENDTLKNKVVNKTDTISNKNNEVVKKDTIKVVKKDEITPPINNKNKNSTVSNGNYLTPQKGKSYIIVASLESAEKAEGEKQRLSQLGIKVQIIPAENTKYRLTLGVYNTTKEAVDAYENFHSAHKNIHPWLWEN